MNTLSWTSWAVYLLYTSDFAWRLLNYQRNQKCNDTQWVLWNIWKSIILWIVWLFSLERIKIKQMIFTEVIHKWIFKRTTQSELKSTSSRYLLSWSHESVSTKMLMISKNWKRNTFTVHQTDRVKITDNKITYKCRNIKMNNIKQQCQNY